MTPPDMFAEYHDVRTTGQFIRLDEPSPQDRMQAEKPWQFEACLDPLQLLRFTDAAEDFPARGVCADGLENVASALAVEELHQRSLGRIWQRSHENGVDDAENRARRAYAKSDRQGHDQRKAGSLPDGPNGLPEVLKHGHAAWTESQAERLAGLSRRSRVLVLHLFSWQKPRTSRSACPGGCSNASNGSPRIGIRPCQR